MSVQTSNHYLRAVKQFTRWLHRHKRLRDDPLIHLEMLNVQVDRRHDRRALSDDEVTRLLKATKEGGTVLGMAASERLMLYVVALSTGLRASELASLNAESLRLLDDPPTVTVKAGYSKRRRRDVLPLPTDILAAVREWLATKPAGGELWPGNWAKNRYAGKILQVDLVAADVAYEDASGLFADFHALRHTFITNLGRHGVPLVAAQKLARHSTPVLTAARYTHIDLQDQHREVQKLPPLQLGRNLGRSSGTNCQNASPNGTPRAEGADEKSDPETPQNPAKNGVLCSNSERRGRDSNPGYPCGHSGFQDRCNRPLCHLSNTCHRNELRSFCKSKRSSRCTPSCTNRLKTACFALHDPVGLSFTFAPVSIGRAGSPSTADPRSSRLA